MDHHLPTRCCSRRGSTSSRRDWPLLDRQSFERVTGAKRDYWLAQTVGVLVTCIGGTLVLAERLDRVSRELRLLAGASAGGLAAVDLVFAVRGRISKVYLLDAAIETPFLAQLAALRPDRSEGRGLPLLRPAA
jgi:hypothetical protein